MRTDAGVAVATAYLAGQWQPDHLALIRQDSQQPKCSSLSGGWSLVRMMRQTFKAGPGVWQVGPQESASPGSGMKERLGREKTTIRLVWPRWPVQLWRPEASMTGQQLIRRRQQL
jgi:hypothetical protein